MKIHRTAQGSRAGEDKTGGVLGSVSLHWLQLIQASLSGLCPGSQVNSLKGSDRGCPSANIWESPSPSPPREPGGAVPSVWG